MFRRIALALEGALALPISLTKKMWPSMAPAPHVGYLPAPRHASRKRARVRGARSEAWAANNVGRGHCEPFCTLPAGFFWKRDAGASDFGGQGFRSCGLFWRVYRTPEGAL